MRASEQRAVVQRPTPEAPACVNRVNSLCQLQERFCITISRSVHDHRGTAERMACSCLAVAMH